MISKFNAAVVQKNDEGLAPVAPLYIESLNLIERLHLVHEVLDLGVNVERQGKGIRSLLGSLVGESAQAKGCAHLGRLELNLGVARAIEVHRATTILVLANLGEDDSGGSELSRLLN